MAVIRKLAFVISYLYDGGAERVTAALANEICRLPGWEVHLITYEEAPGKEYPLDRKVIRHTLPPLEGGRLGRIGARFSFLRDTVRRIGPDCVVSLGAAHVVALLSLAMAGSGIPLILSERNDPARAPKPKAKRLMRFLSYLCCDGVVFQTAGARDYFPAPIRRKGTVICNPITANLPEGVEGTRDRRIVNFCRLVPQKNLDLLMDAFADIAAEFPDHTLYIYGEGPERGRLERKIRDSHLEDRIRLPGYSSDIYNEIRSAALFVSSSDYEGISNSMLEAIALGVPSICTDCPPGGARETIDHGVNGLLVPTGDAAALAAAMRQVLSDPQLAAGLSRAGSSLRHRFSVASITEKWLRFIEKHIR